MVCAIYPLLCFLAIQTGERSSLAPLFAEKQEEGKGFPALYVTEAVDSEEKSSYSQVTFPPRLEASQSFLEVDHDGEQLEVPVQDGEPIQKVLVSRNVGFTFQDPNGLR